MLIKFWREIIILILTCVCFICYFIGKKSAPKPSAEIRIEKVVDQELVQKEIEKEKIKIRSQIHQKKVRDTIRLPDGTLKTHEIVEMQKNDIKISNLEKTDSVNADIKEVEKVTLKSPENSFALEIFGGVRKNNVQDLNLDVAHSFSDPSTVASLKFDYFWSNNFSNYILLQQQNIGKSQASTSLEVGASWRVEFN
jgi:hypothetical protein